MTPTMSRRRVLQGLGMLGLGGVSFVGWIALSHAQPTADKPAVKVGDKWEFRVLVKDSLGGDSVTGWSRRIVEILPNDQMRVARGDGTVYLADGSWNEIDSRGAEYSLIDYRFPMTVGATWSYTARERHGQDERRGDYKVAAFEPITVPAGTFECFRVEGELQRNGRNFTMRATDVYWYCPKINFLAKQRREFVRQPKGELQTREIRASELTAFTPGQ